MRPATATTLRQTWAMTSSRFEHNNIRIELVPKEACCGMPNLNWGSRLGRSAQRAKHPGLAKLVDEGYDLIAPIPSCVLMYKQELLLMFPDDPDVQKVQEAFFDPFEYLYLRHKAGHLNLISRPVLETSVTRSLPSARAKYR